MVIPTRQLPHLARLVEDYFYDYGKVGEFYSGDFRVLASFERQTERVRSRRLPREGLAAVLREQNESYGCGPQTLAQIEKITREKACAVVTGQQVGLFSGPLYTIYKALTAVKLSEHLNLRRLGSFVPIFWLASDDHDLAEVDHIGLVDKANRIEEIRCPTPASESKIPVSNIFLPPAISDCIRQLKDLTLDSEFKADVIDHLADAYRPGRSFVEAFARWMTRLFGTRGLIFIDASQPRLKEMGSEIFCREISEVSPSTREAVATARRLRQSGYDEQVQLHEGILNIFYAERERRTIRSQEGAYDITGMPLSTKKEELLTLAKEKPFLFSPNVLLRPIYQDALLPTVAYIGGQAEIAYFAQLKRVYESFQLPMPVIYPRKSLTIVERKIDHILKKYNLKIPDLWRDTAGTIGEISQEQIPDPVQKALLLVSGHLEQDLESLKGEVAAFEPTLRESVDLARGKMNQQLKYMEKKILQAARRRNETTVRQIHKAVDNLYPNQRLQERVFNIVPYLIKYGDQFMDGLDQAMDIEEHDHQVMFA